MNIRDWRLRAYTLLLRLYPRQFSRRFAPEMLQIAEAAEASEWPLMFWDTGVAIVRCWIEGSYSTTAEPDSYMPVGEFQLNVPGLLRGVALAFLLTTAVGYVSYRWPPPCPKTEHLLTHIVSPPQAGPQTSAK